MNDLPESEVLLASTVKFLVEGGNQEEAAALAACTITYEAGESYFSGEHYIQSVNVVITGPRAAYELFQDRSRFMTLDAQDDITHTTPRAELMNALNALLPTLSPVSNIILKAELVTPTDNWRTELLAFMQGVSNQATGFKPKHLWNNLGFRSATEVKIAEALERKGVMFLPNCMARLGSPGDRKNREADFMIFQGGKVGILEVDGEPFHPPTRTVQDHERDRLFKVHGIKVVEHYDATRCFGTPDAVIDEFLSILAAT